MKYSLRSLMTFSIRELMLVTVIVGLAVGWGVDRVRRAENRMAEEIEKSEKAKCDLRLAEQRLVLIREYQNEMERLRSSSANSQAGPPKDP